MLCIFLPSLHLIWRYKTECTSDVLHFLISIASHLKWHILQVYIICIIPSFSHIKIQLDRFRGAIHMKMCKAMHIFRTFYSPLPPRSCRKRMLWRGWSMIKQSGLYDILNCQQLNSSHQRALLDFSLSILQKDYWLTYTVLQTLSIL